MCEMAGSLLCLSTPPLSPAPHSGPGAHAPTGRPSPNAPSLSHTSSASRTLNRIHHPHSQWNGVTDVLLVTQPHPGQSGVCSLSPAGRRQAAGCAHGAREGRRGSRSLSGPGRLPGRGSRGHVRNLFQVCFQPLSPPVATRPGFPDGESHREPGLGQGWDRQKQRDP